MQNESLTLKSKNSELKTIKKNGIYFIKKLYLLSVEQAHLDFCSQNI